MIQFTTHNKLSPAKTLCYLAQSKPNRSRAWPSLKHSAAKSAAKSKIQNQKTGGWPGPSSSRPCPMPSPCRSSASLPGTRSFPTAQKYATSAARAARKPSWTAGWPRAANRPRHTILLNPERCTLAPCHLGFDHPPKSFVRQSASAGPHVPCSYTCTAGRFASTGSSIRHAAST